MQRLTVLVFAIAGCSVINDTERFSEDEPCALELKVRAFDPHIDQLVEARLVQDQRGALNLLARAVIDPLPFRDVDLLMPIAVPPLLSLDFERPYIDFYADLSQNRLYDAPPTDHTWRLEDACETGPELFPHNTNFFPLPEPIGRGFDVRVRTCGDEIPNDPAIEVRVHAVGERLQTDQDVVELERTSIGFYRLGSTRLLADRGEREIVLADIIGDVAPRYEIEVIIDRNRNMKWDDGADQEDAFRYIFDRASAPDCPRFVATECLMPLRDRDPIPACLDAEGNIVVTVSPAHLTNTFTPSEPAWAFCRMAAGCPE